jgi:hypothetical protein
MVCPCFNINVDWLYHVRVNLLQQRGALMPYCDDVRDSKTTGFPLVYDRFSEKLTKWLIIIL